jgi:hypothetical protein
MAPLTGTKVYVRSNHLAIAQAWKLFYPINSRTYKTGIGAAESSHRWPASVHNWAFPVKNSSAVQQNPDATLEENP